MMNSRSPFGINYTPSCAEKVAEELRGCLQVIESFKSGLESVRSEPAAAKPIEQSRLEIRTRFNELRSLLDDRQEALFKELDDADRERYDWLERSLNFSQMRLAEAAKLKEKEIENLKIEYEALIADSERRYKRELDETREKLSAKSTTVEDLNAKLAEANERLSRSEEISERHRDHQQIIHELTAKVSLLDEQLRDKDGQFRRLQAAIGDEQNERLKMATLFEEKEKQLTKAEEAATQLTTDLNKANEIIRKLQNEVQSTHGHLSILNKVANKQDEVVLSKEDRVKRLESELKVYSEKVKVKDKQYQEMKRELDSLKTKFDESRQQAKTNEEVITWLNKQLSSLQSKHGGAKALPSLLPEVNLTRPQQARKRTDPKEFIQRNKLFVTGSARVPADPFKR